MAFNLNLKTNLNTEDGKTYRHILEMIILQNVNVIGLSITKLFYLSKIVGTFLGPSVYVEMKWDSKQVHIVQF